MFLKVTQRRNPNLIEIAKKLHQSGQILPDTYVLDLDTIIQNTKKLKSKADENGIELFYMTKQIGRNPLVAKKIHEAGIENAVVVDYKEALMMMSHNLPIGNVGHLVQIPQSLLEKIIAYQPKYVTVYSIEMLQQIDKVSKKLNQKQKVLIKVTEADDQIYEGQYGGFHLNQLSSLSDEYPKMSHVEIAGITSFPCFLFDGKDELKPTHNVKTVNQAIQLLEEYGIHCTELNLPSATCSATLPFIKQIGGTQGEPGHALTGTTPLHAKLDLEELPAMVYVSEISHNLDNQGYFYGGGYYPRGHLENIVVSNSVKDVYDKIEPLANDSIDYYLTAKNVHEVGSTVIAAFRTQIFVTRSDVAVVSGIQTGNPKIEGIFDSLGNLVRR